MEPNTTLAAVVGCTSPSLCVYYQQHHSSSDTDHQLVNHHLNHNDEFASSVAQYATFDPPSQFAYNAYSTIDHPSPAAYFHHSSVPVHQTLHAHVDYGDEQEQQQQHNYMLPPLRRPDEEIVMVVVDGGGGGDIDDDGDTDEQRTEEEEPGMRRSVDEEEEEVLDGLGWESAQQSLLENIFNAQSNLCTNLHTRIIISINVLHD
jgi:hypothetical protein